MDVVHDIAMLITIYPVFAQVPQEIGWITDLGVNALFAAGCYFFYLFAKKGYEKRLAEKDAIIRYERAQKEKWQDRCIRLTIDTRSDMKEMISNYHERQG